MVHKNSVSDFQNRLKRRYTLDLDLLEECVSEIARLKSHLEVRGPDADFSRGCAVLMNTAAHISDGELWEYLQKFYSTSSCVLDVDSLEF